MKGKGYIRGKLSLYDNDDDDDDNPRPRGVVRVSAPAISKERGQTKLRYVSHVVTVITAVQ
jgi:hypothetical protein